MWILLRDKADLTGDANWTEDASTLPTPATAPKRFVDGHCTLKLWVVFVDEDGAIVRGGSCSLQLMEVATLPTVGQGVALLGTAITGAADRDILSFEGLAGGHEYTVRVTAISAPVEARGCKVFAEWY